jgi:hypothetical protein
MMGSGIFSVGGDLPALRRFLVVSGSPTAR